jgi:hypothetical protein
LFTHALADDHVSVRTVFIGTKIGLDRSREVAVTARSRGFDLPDCGSFGVGVGVGVADVKEIGGDKVRVAAAPWA